jgi:hypothetical protein
MQGAPGASNDGSAEGGRGSGSATRRQARKADSRAVDGNLAAAAAAGWGQTRDVKRRNEGTVDGTSERRRASDVKSQGNLRRALVGLMPAGKKVIVKGTRARGWSELGDGGRMRNYMGEKLGMSYMISAPSRTTAGEWRGAGGGGGQPRAPLCHCSPSLS